MTNRVLYPLLAAGVILLVSLSGLNAQQSSGEAISIGGDDIGGVVTSNKGPEAGVWVIAETADLSAKFVKIVVPMIGGTTYCRSFPMRTTKYGCAATGSWIPSGAGHARQGCQSDCGRGAEPACSSGILPSHLLVFLAPRAGQERVPRQRAQRQRHP